MESVNVENKQPQKIDRVVLDSESIAVIQKISDQVQSELGDLVQISQKDIVNFLIQERSVDLTIAEISKIKSKHFDIVRALKRATQEAIRAKQDGHEIQMDELLKIIQTPSVSKTEGVRKPRGRRSKEGLTPTPTDQSELSNDHYNNGKSSKNRLETADSKPQKISTDQNFPESKST